MDTPRGSSPPQEVPEVADRLHSAAIHLLRRVRAREGEPGLSPPRLSALSVVVLAGPISVGELAAAEQVRSPTMTRLVDGLVRDGLVVREPHPADGRSVRVRATETGKLILSRGRAKRLEELGSSLAALDPEELRTLALAADLIERVARERPLGPVDGLTPEQDEPGAQE
jgi:DNA-binding MarR family transcriptional regulator